MVNTEKFAKRLHKILEFYDLSAASFADKIEVGRSSISHILSGRNKPSLDFVMKIVKTFPEVELYWLLNGKGNFPHESKKPDPVTPASPTQEIPSQRTFQSPPPQIPQEKKENHSVPVPRTRSNGKNIRKIVIFYEDGTFDAFEN